MLLQILDVVLLPVAVFLGFWMLKPKKRRLVKGAEPEILGDVAKRHNEIVYKLAK